MMMVIHALQSEPWASVGDACTVPCSCACRQRKPHEAAHAGGGASSQACRHALVFQGCLVFCNMLPHAEQAKSNGMGIEGSRLAIAPDVGTPLGGAGKGGHPPKAGAPPPLRLQQHAPSGPSATPPSCRQRSPSRHTASPGASPPPAPPPASHSPDFPCGCRGPLRRNRPWKSLCN